MLLLLLLLLLLNRLVRRGSGLVLGVGRLLCPVEDSLKDDGFYLNAYFEVRRAGTLCCSFFEDAETSF